MSDFCTSSSGKSQPDEKMKCHCLLGDTLENLFAKLPRLPVEHDGISTAYPRLSQTCFAARFEVHIFALAYRYLTESHGCSPLNMMLVLPFHGIS
jgi:hypothetical protein